MCSLLLSTKMVLFRWLYLFTEFYHVIYYDMCIVSEVGMTINILKELGMVLEYDIFTKGWNTL